MRGLRGAVLARECFDVTLLNVLEDTLAFVGMLTTVDPANFSIRESVRAQCSIRPVVLTERTGSVEISYTLDEIIVWSLDNSLF